MERGREMKIVTYNVNGLRQRISQFGSLLKLLNSFDADIICFQETKLRRQELTADIVMADGYESFFSCTRTINKGRTGYSGVATFCRVKSAFSSNEVALPVAAEEGFTGLVDGSRAGKSELVEGLEEFEKDELHKIDCEGRCVITDHSHFVLFNLYGPRADSDDAQRIQFKLTFYKILQKRWENLLSQGRRIFIVGDLNIAPTALDRCDAGPDFEDNEFRRWFRSMLVDSGGSFYDAFRAKHPDRQGAYTCWPSSTGAEQFNYGTRIDHILCAGSCLHQEDDLQDHSIIMCHVKECDILTNYKRWKPGATPRYRWKGGSNIKLEGSDHAPVYVTLAEISDIPQHSTPSLSARFLPMISGVQQTLVSVLMKRQAATQVQSHQISSSFSGRDASMRTCTESATRLSSNCSTSCTNIGDSCFLNENSNGAILETDKGTKEFALGDHLNTPVTLQSEDNLKTAEKTKKKARKSQWSQLSLKSFFQKNQPLSSGSENSSIDNLSDVPDPNHHASGTLALADQSSSRMHCEPELSTSTQDEEKVNISSSATEKNNVAFLEWQRIQQLMQSSIPLCKGHKKPCVARIVKKPGPTFGRRFYVCARAEGPASNPEANCGYFKWASSKPRRK
ncbi:hypothetical protein Tsubulata_023592 [Turnera subulata]|uniref:DNA-(apurinic or apyrimidinic site) endonuclease n=1 Tax=Turnera subulata TaxID=218843 RepID=A0A9Q0JK39_9ROSI|nr:hypothetical protein Tsubulata_023592 [Turnera subulata]